MNEEKKLNLKQILIIRALEDKEFKQKLLENPKKTIEEEFQVKLPDDLEISVIENQKKKWSLVIPYVSEELSDEELEAFAGGGILYDIGSGFVGAKAMHEFARDHSTSKINLYNW